MSNKEYVGIIVSQQILHISRWARVLVNDTLFQFNLKNYYRRGERWNQSPEKSTVGLLVYVTFDKRGEIELVREC